MPCSETLHLQSVAKKHHRFSAASSRSCNFRSTSCTAKYLIEKKKKKHHFQVMQNPKQPCPGEHSNGAGAGAAGSSRLRPLSTRPGRAGSAAAWLPRSTAASRGEQSAPACCRQRLLHPQHRASSVFTSYPNLRLAQRSHGQGRLSRAAEPFASHSFPHAPTGCELAGRNRRGYSHNGKIPFISLRMLARARSPVTGARILAGIS